MKIINILVQKILVPILKLVVLPLAVFSKLSKWEITAIVVWSILFFILIGVKYVGSESNLPEEFLYRPARPGLTMMILLTIFANLYLGVKLLIKKLIKK